MVMELLLGALLVSGQSMQLPDDDGRAIPAARAPERHVLLWERLGVERDDNLDALALWVPRVALVTAMMGGVPLLAIPVVGPLVVGGAAALLACWHHELTMDLGVGRVDPEVAIAAVFVVPQAAGAMTVVLGALTAGAFVTMSFVSYSGPVSYVMSTNLLWGAWGVLALGLVAGVVTAVGGQVVTALALLLLRREHLRQVGALLTGRVS